MTVRSRAVTVIFTGCKTAPSDPRSNDPGITNIPRRNSHFSRGTIATSAHYRGTRNNFLPQRAEEHIMIDAVVIQPASETIEPSVAGVSWAAVTAGAVVSCALTFVLLAFGIGLGLSVVSPWAGSGVSATTFKIGTGLYLIVIAMLSSSIGGYLAGRLRTGWVGVHSDEVYFRDTAHGFVAWALASVLGAVLLASPAGSLISGGASGATQGAAANRGSPFDGYVDTLLRSDTPASQAAGNSNETRGEMLRLFSSSFRNGAELKPGDREYVSKVVAARTGLSQADADKRVNAVVTQAKADLDATRKATAQLAFWLTASLLIGAFCASLAATEGGGLRDGTWGSKNLGSRARRQ
ncbi:MAG: hypothetical protein ABI192_19760 [Bradyrhizobium sp.]